MCDNNKFYICEHCGNLIGMINDAGGAYDVLWTENDKA